MIRRPPTSTPLYSSAASDVYKRQQPDRWRSAPAAGRQEPLTVGAACGLAAGPDQRGTGSNAGSYCAAAVGRCWAEDFVGRCSSLLQAAHDHLQKNALRPELAKSKSPNRNI